MVQIRETTQCSPSRLRKTCCSTVECSYLIRTGIEFLVKCNNHSEVGAIMLQMVFSFFWYMFGCGWLCLAEKFLQRRKWFCFFVVTTRLFDEALPTICAKQPNCRFLVFFRECSNHGWTLCLEYIRNSLHHSLSMYGHRHNFVVTKTFRDSRQLQKHLRMIFVSLQKNNSPGHTTRKTNYLTSWCAVGTNLVASVKRLKSLFVHAKFPRTHFLSEYSQ